MEIPTLSKILHDLHAILGFGVHLYDNKCRNIANCSQEYCYCNLIHTVSPTLSICGQFDRVCFRSAAESRDVYTALCPFGIYNAICAIYDEDELLGYLLLSGAVENTLAAKEHILQAGLHFLPEQEEMLRAAIRFFPEKNSTQLDAIPTVLRSVCQYIANNSLFPTEKLTLGALAKCYIHENLQSRLTLQTICEHLHYSRSTLTAEFRREFGMSVVTYINQERLKLAAKRLLSTNETISNIAMLCGFSSAEYFSNLFKKEYGCSPLVYRRSYKKAEA